MVDCPKCSENYHSLSQHWAMSNCSYPDFTDTQWNTAIGLMMGDGSLNYGKKNPILQVQCINKEYLEYLDDLFGYFGNGVSFVKTAEESADSAVKSGLRPNAKSGNYSDVYGWYTRTHPDLNNLDWYVSDEKIWPDDITLQPETLKHWYCGDGTWNNRGVNNYVQIAMSNEIENVEKVTTLFQNSGLPIPNNYSIVKREDGRRDCTAQFTVSDSEKLWEYMGKPPSGFEYKWPEKYH